MELAKAIELISPAAYRFTEKSSWADLGSGTGLFTRALAQLLQKGSTVYAVDTSLSALNNMKPLPHINLQKLEADFIRETLPLSALDGILMANAFHFVRDKTAFIYKAQRWLKSSGCFLLVEYDTDTPNSWLPFPVSFSSATKLFQQSGFGIISKLGMQPSVYYQAGMYAALIAH